MEYQDVIYSVFLLLLLSCIGDAIRCFKCQNIQFPRDCTKVIDCKAEERCFVQEVVASSGNVYFNTGCLPKSQCLPAGASLVGKRSAHNTSSISRRFSDLTTCTECCQGNFCNRNGCGTKEIPRPQRGPYCFNCNAALDAKRCIDVTVCGLQEVCMLYSPVEYATLPEPIYKGQCERGLICNAVSNTLNNHNCSPLCCNTDFCNVHCRSSQNITSATSNAYTTTLQSSTRRPTLLAQTHKSTQSVSKTRGTTVPPGRHHIEYILLHNSDAKFCVHLFMHRSSSWYNARNVCKNHGGDLVVLDSRAKATLMRNKLKETGGKGYWIGAHVKEQDGQFTWVNNHTLPDHNAEWGPGQPVRIYTAKQHDCVAMVQNAEYKWKDFTCGQEIFNFICERSCSQ